MSNYTKAIGLPNAEAEFLAWSEEEPEIARRLVTVGEFLDAGGGQHHAVAGRAWQIAVNLNPLLEDAHFLIAAGAGAARTARIGLRWVDPDHQGRRVSQRTGRSKSTAGMVRETGDGLAFLGRELSESRQAQRIRVSKRHLQEALDGLRRGLGRFTDDENDRIIEERFNDLMARVELALRDMEL